MLNDKDKKYIKIIDKLKKYKIKYHKEQVKLVSENQHWTHYSLFCRSFFRSIIGFICPSYRKRWIEQLTDINLVFYLPDNLSKSIVDIILKYNFEDKRDLLIGLDIFSYINYFVELNKLKLIILNNYKDPEKLFAEMQKLV